MERPKEIHAIGDEIAIIWESGTESYIRQSDLRAASPSAETAGERDIFGTQYGGEFKKNYSSVTVKNWEFVGSYAMRFEFSDGHRTGLYSFDYLYKITAAQ
ncbi:DUF971 domain-containing protein [Puniceicoccaceae bacterium K14]|nr:DUF971 domain-containing protein [Puniceicoccaceae bacterium K14]